MRLSYAQKSSLVALLERERDLEVYRREGNSLSRLGVAGGTKEGMGEGSTLGALADRGLVRIRETKWPYKRLVAQLTDAGRVTAEALERRKREG